MLSLTEIQPKWFLFVIAAKISICLAAPGLSCIIWNSWSLCKYAGSFSCHKEVSYLQRRDLVPQPGVKPRTSILGVWRLNHRITRKSLWLQYFKPLIGSVMAACWSEMESIHGINVWDYKANGQRHPHLVGKPKGTHDVDNTDEVCWLLISNWELMRNGSIYNTSWENQSRGTLSYHSICNFSLSPTTIRRMNTVFHGHGWSQILWCPLNLDSLVWEFVQHI